MTTLKPRIVFHDTAHGDDELGDGSFECPVRSHTRAQQIQGAGDVIASNYVLKSFPPASSDLGSDGHAHDGLLLVGGLTLCVAVAVAAVVLILLHPLLLVWLFGSAALFVSAGLLATRPERPCTCGHTREIHQHYRGGSDCAGRMSRLAIDGRPWSKPCNCTRYRRPSRQKRAVV